MKSKILFIFLLGFLCATVKAGQIKWLGDYTEASRIARNAKKPMLLSFTAEWCYLCRKMDDEFWTRADVSKFAEDFVTVKINIDTNAELKKHYEVTATPTIILTDAVGNPVLSNRGYGQNIDKRIIEKMIAVPKDYSEVFDALNSLETNKTDVSALEKLADFYRQKNLFAQSNEYLEKILSGTGERERREIAAVSIGYNLLSLTKFKDAIEAFDKFQMDYPESPQLEKAIYGKLITFKRINQLQKAREAFDELKSRFPKSELTLQAERILPPNAPQTSK